MSVSFFKLKSFKRFLFFKNCQFCSLSLCSSDSTSSTPNNKSNNSTSKYKIFQDEDSPVILDVSEEKRLYRSRALQDNISTEVPINVFKRGITGVFDVEELVEILKKDNGQDIFVVKLCKELKYVDYLVIVTGRSKKHLLGLAEYIRGVFKKKRNDSDLIPKIEGENSAQWIAMDLGNIALHIMSSEAREIYDLESLWSLGSEFDSKIQEKEVNILQLLKKHSVLLDDIEPLQRG